MKHTLEVIATSRAYQAPTVETSGAKEAFVFRGPLTRRLGAEQFSDAINALTNDWNRLPSSLEFDFTAGGAMTGLKLPQWIWTDEPVGLGPQRIAVRAATAALDAATKSVLAVQKKADEAVAKGEPIPEDVRAAGERVSAAVVAAQAELAAAQQLPPPPEPGALRPEGERHRVVFRKAFQLDAVPAEAYAAILVSQSWQVQVNGREAKPIQRDGFRNGRIALFDLKPLLKAGENLIVIDVSSHTEKQMNDVERAKFPGSLTHLNKQSGLAFYARLTPANGAEPTQILTDETWRARRAPDGRWNAAEYSDKDWASAKALPAGVTPVDEGPSLEPLTRKDFANLPVELGPQVNAIVSTTAQAGRIRTALLAADPLQVALDRPNREIVIPARTNVATTIQALELTNGITLNSRLQKAAAKFAPEAARDPGAWLDHVYRHALSRSPSPQEREIALELLEQPASAEGVADFLWVLLNLPEFQLIN